MQQIMIRCMLNFCGGNSIMCLHGYLYTIVRRVEYHTIENQKKLYMLGCQTLEIYCDELYHPKWSCLLIISYGIAQFPIELTVYM